MSSTSILGHRLQIDSLLLDAEKDNVSHAYLFTGPGHIGKFTVGKWFAEHLLTVDAADETERKAIAHQVERLIHADLFVIDRLWMEDTCEDFEVLGKYSNVPQQHRAKAKAKTDTISIEDIRVLQERLHEVGGGRYRVCLIRRAERMQQEAVNALLKILEEPPPGVVFILTSDAPTSLLPTLLSRSRILRFSRLPAKELQPLVAGLDQEEAQFLVALAQGAPGIIHKLQEDPDALLAERSLYAKAVAFWQSRSLLERLQLMKPLHERSEEADQFLLHLALALRKQPPGSADAFNELVRGLETNVSRQMLVQRFVLNAVI